MKIESVYYFNYTSSIGYYKSIRNFRDEEMTYTSMALSTSKIRVNATPDVFKIGVSPSSKIREIVISYLDNLKEISQLLAENSPKYILIIFDDESKMYFEYDEKFCAIFELICQHSPQKEFNDIEYVSPYAIQKTSNSDLCTNSSLTYNSQKVQAAVTKKNNDKSFKFKRFALTFIIILFVLGIISTLSQEDESTKKLTPVNEPKSGEVLSGREVYNGSEITVITDDNESCLVKLKDINDVTVMSFYVRAGDTVSVGVPAETLYVCFARGETWYGEENLFGEHTKYSMVSEMRDFTNYTYEFELYLVENGNLRLTSMDAEDF